MVVAELLGKENGIFVIVGVDHIGFQSYIPFCVGDAGRPKESSSWRSITRRPLSMPASIPTATRLFQGLVTCSPRIPLSPPTRQHQLTHLHSIHPFQIPSCFLFSVPSFPGTFPLFPPSSSYSSLPSSHPSVLPLAHYHPPQIPVFSPSFFFFF